MIQIGDEVETLEGDFGVVEEIYYRIKNKPDLVKHEHTFFKKSVTPFGEIRVGQWDIVFDSMGRYPIDDVLVKYNGKTKSVKEVSIHVPECREYRKQKLQIAYLQNKILNAQKELQQYVDSTK